MPTSKEIYLNVFKDASVFNQSVTMGVDKPLGSIKLPSENWHPYPPPTCFGRIDTKFGCSSDSERVHNCVFTEPCIDYRDFWLARAKQKVINPDKFDANIAMVKKGRKSKYGRLRTRMNEPTNRVKVKFRKKIKSI